MAAGTEPARQLGPHDAGGDGAILQRRGVVVQRDEHGEAGAHFGGQRPQNADPFRCQIHGDAARHHAIHHQSMAKTAAGGTQHALP